MKVHFRNAGLIAALFSIASMAHADPPAPPRASLAGTFNNWNTSDPDYTLKPVGDKLELVRSWPCGTYEFKFVFDGSWAKHLGDAGGGKLTQPGGDIKLAIPQSGTYAIQLNPKAAQWTLAKQSPDNPIARIVLRGAELSASFVELDARTSEARAGSTIKQYKWSVESNHEGGQFRALTQDWSRAVFFVTKPGDYTVRLSIDDAGSTNSATATVRLGDGWRFLLNRSAGAVNTPMLPMGRNTWGAMVAPVARTFEPSINHYLLDQDRSNITWPELNGRRPSDRTMVLFDSTSNRASLVESGAMEFRFIAGSQMNEVFERVDLVGDFNGWRPGANRMVALPESEPNYRALLQLPDGVHHYKFVINGTIFVNDPNSDPRLTDADGNSGVRVGPDPEKLGPVKPNDLIAAGFFHDPSSNTWYSPIAGDAATVTVRTLADDVQSVEFHTGNGKHDDPLRRVDRRDGFDYWRGQMVLGEDVREYWFIAADGDARMRFDAAGVTDARTPVEKPFQGSTDMHFKTPDWAKSVVWYQIFPERFRNGDTSNDPPGTVPWNHEWFKPYKGPSTGGGTINEKGKFFEYIYDRRYGGDLQGVRDKLPYLRELGVTAIYFNPIFLAESLHKYDASDYRHIDDFFGVKDSLKKIKGETDDPRTWQWSETDKLFLDFLQEAHRQGFKVVLDGVFNHVGRDFWAFKDVLKHGEKSPYAGWFDIESFKPFHYKAWDKPDGALPRLKHDDKLGLAVPVREHLFAVTRRWMDPNGDGNPSDGIDGWRLDVAGDISVDFWRDWRALVKKINPEAYIVAELWQESRAWLDGNSFDAVMNYPFAVRSQRFFVNDKKASKPSVFFKEIHEILGWYAPHVNHCLQNLYDSHDTDRLASMFLNPDLEYDQANRPQDNGPNYNTGRPTAENYHRMKLAVTWQMMFLGCPMIYYGNEVGMFGADDPTDRKPMLWPDLLPYDDAEEKIEPGVYEHHQRMIAIRNTYRALRLGSFESVYHDDKRGIAAFVRRLGGEAVLVVINNSDKQRRVRLPNPWDGKGEVYRVDDPAVAEIKPAASSKDRATIAIKQDAKTPVVIEKGAVKGITLAPRTAGVFVMVER